MTQEEFLQLQSNHQKSGLSLKSYLLQRGKCYSTYNYWRRKCCSKKPPHELAPISFRHTESSAALFIGEMPSGATLLFANGLRAHVGSGTEDVLRELLGKKLMSHVLP